MKKTDQNLLEQSRLALNNAGEQQEIKAALTEIGYDETVLAEGKTLLTEAQTAYQNNQKEDNERSEAYLSFTRAYEDLYKSFRTHRKKAKIIFRNEPGKLKILAIDKPLPKAYISQLNLMKQFYRAIQENTDMQRELDRLNLAADEITNSQTKITDLEAKRSNYLKEKGESQNATELKDAALEKLDKWMSDFYAVAYIALEDNPQLMESLAKLVRS